MSVPFLCGELVLVLAVIYHGVNGLRVALMDFRPQLWRYQRQMTLGTFGLVAMLYAPAFILMVGHMRDLITGK
jgi:succinate dehydrogenase / fumarate reductase cytochrome b subunit